MRIMHVLKHARPSNGHVHVAVDLACAQADEGHQVTLASSGGPYDDLLREHGVDVALVPEASRAWEAARSAQVLLRVARRVRPQVVHSHMMSSTVLAYPVAKLVRATLVTTVHNSFDRHSRLMQLGDVVVAVSEAERRRLLDRGFPARKLRCVLNGAIGSARQEVPEWRDVGSFPTPCVASLSGLHERKAVGDIITAFAKVLPSTPGWHFNIIGGGPDLERLQHQVEDLGLTGSIHFIGMVSAPWPLLERAEVFVSASVDEPFGLNVLEARAAGCAVVATAAGGIPEVLEHGRAGRLVPPSAPEAMAAVLRELLLDEELRRHWQSRARQGIDRFTVRRMAADYEAVYSTARDAG